jgi:hypothetical protein
VSDARPEQAADAPARGLAPSERARLVGEPLADIRTRRDAAIRSAFGEGDIAARELGRRCGHTASQISAIWRRAHPARPRRPEAP